MKKNWPENQKQAIKNNRLLVISPFNENVKYITQDTANIRNEIMAELADEIFMAHYTENGNLHQLIKNVKNKKISTFDFKTK